MKVASRLAPALLVLWALAPSSGAWAFEPTKTPVGDHFLGLFEAAGMKDLTYSSFVESGPDMTIDGLTGSFIDGKDEFTLKIGKLKLSGGQIGADKVLSLDNVDLSGLSVTSKDLSFTADSSNTSGVKIPPIDSLKDNTTFHASTVYESSVVTRFAISTQDGLYLPGEEMRVTNANFLGKIPRETKFSITNVEMTSKNLPSGQFKTTLTDLGYEVIRFNVSGDSKWDDQTGIFELPNFSITGSDFADMIWSFKLGGWTPELFQGLTTLDPSNDQKAQDILGKLQATSINEITLNIDNKSIVDRVLDQQSKKAGVERSEFVDKTMSSIAIPLTFLKNPKFQEMISTQLKSFLSDPRSIKVQVAPEKPIPVSQIVGMAAIAPQTIPDILGVNIEATK